MTMQWLQQRTDKEEDLPAAEEVHPVAAEVHPAAVDLPVEEVLVECRFLLTVPIGKKWKTK